LLLQKETKKSPISMTARNRNVPWFSFLLL